MRGKQTNDKANKSTKKRHEPEPGFLTTGHLVEFAEEVFQIGLNNIHVSYVLGLEVFHLPLQNGDAGFVG